MHKFSLNIFNCNLDYDNNYIECPSSYVTKDLIINFLFKNVQSSITIKLKFNIELPPTFSLLGNCSTMISTHDCMCMTAACRKHCLNLKKKIGIHVYYKLCYFQIYTYYYN